MNLKVRLKNPVFIVQLVLSIFVPILGYFGLTAEEITTWVKLFGLLKEAVMNPYVLGIVLVSLWNALNDPTTKGIGDSERAKSYTKVK